MTKIFYDHLVMIDDLFTEIDHLELNAGEKTQAKKLVDDILHHKVWIHILDLLPKQHHREFLEKFHRAPYDIKHVAYLSEKTERDMHSEIFLIGTKVKTELRQEIRKNLERKKRKT